MKKIWYIYIAKYYTTLKEGNYLVLNNMNGNEEHYVK
jgi:hypothetical protein